MGIILQENFEPCKDRIVFTFEKDKIDQVVNDIVKKISKNHIIKGFRKGKAPPQIIKIVAKDTILNEAKHRLTNEAWQEIQNETKLKPFGEPEIAKIDISYSNFSIDLNLGYVPNFELMKYKGFELAEPKVPEETEIVQHILAEISKTHPILRPYGEDDFVMDGDSVIVDYISTINGASFEHSNASGITIDVGSNRFVRDFEVGIMGMKPGEQREFDIAFPETVNNKTIAGNVVHFVVTILSGIKKDPPVFDEDFAKKLGHDTLEALNKAILDRAKTQIASIRKNTLKKAVFDILLESNTIETPEWMILKSAQAVCVSNGLKWEENNEEVNTHFMKEGLRTLTLSMIFDKIRELEVETVLTPQEIQQVLFNNIGQFPPDIQQSVLEQKNISLLSRLYSEIQDEQVFEWIIKNSTILTPTSAPAETKSE